VLDIRATHYVSPLTEVDFASVELTVHLVNLADETGLVTGKFRVYNDTTGLLIHTSDIVPFSLAAGATVDASALTDFDPPAPADDVYFVLFDGKATNALVPDGITFTLGQFYFDVKPTGMGPAPAAHHATHEDAGSDEIDVTGLSGELADDQPALAHDITGARHTSTATPGQLLQADADGLPVDATNTDTEASNVIRQTTPQTLTDGAAIDWDLELGGAAEVTLGGDRTLNAPTHMVDGARYRLKVIQDGTGTRLLTWNAIYRFPAGVHPCLSAAAGNIDIITFDSDGTYMDCVSMVNALA
jgi:hypothetical protein